MAKFVVNWEESIAYCKHVLKQLNNRLEILQNSLEELNRCEEKSQLQKYEEFYNSFQEAYDLYFFWYVGHFLRNEHHHKQLTVPKEHVPLLDGYKIFRYRTPTSFDKDFVDGTEYWKHCISYLLKAL